MGKRFTDTEIWDKDWFFRLSMKHKLLIRFLFDKCDVAGIWDVNFILASTYVGETITVSDLSVLSTHITKLSAQKYLINDFISFQYGTLSETSNPHKKVISTLKKYNLYEGYLKGTLWVKDKEEDKDMEKDKEEDKNEIQIFVLENCPKVSKLETQLTKIQCENLVEKFGVEKVKEKLSAMENKKDLLKKYSNVNLTLQQWLNKDFNKPTTDKTLDLLQQNERVKQILNNQHEPDTDN